MNITENASLHQVTAEYHFQNCTVFINGLAFTTSESLRNHPIMKSLNKEQIFDIAYDMGVLSSLARYEDIVSLISTELLKT